MGLEDVQEANVGLSHARPWTMTSDLCVWQFCGRALANGPWLGMTTHTDLILEVPPGRGACANFVHDDIE